MSWTQFVELEAVDKLLNLVVEFYIQPTLDLMDAAHGRPQEEPKQEEKPAEKKSKKPAEKKSKKRKARDVVMQDDDEVWFCCCCFRVNGANALCAFAWFLRTGEQQRWRQGQQQQEKKACCEEEEEGIGFQQKQIHALPQVSSTLFNAIGMKPAVALVVV
jgi:hypothetical protein